jgi:hypothetical protein
MDSYSYSGIFILSGTSCANIQAKVVEGMFYFKDIRIIKMGYM